jgi:hypothetical protein
MRLILGSFFPGADERAWVRSVVESGFPVGGAIASAGVGLGSFGGLVLGFVRRFGSWVRPAFWFLGSFGASFRRVGLALPRTFSGA